MNTEPSIFAQVMAFLPMHGRLRAQDLEGLIHIGIDEKIEVGQIDLIQCHHRVLPRHHKRTPK
jgi:hypothetical protein